jgi:hypothetical protein
MAATSKIIASNIMYGVALEDRSGNLFAFVARRHQDCDQILYEVVEVKRRARKSANDSHISVAKSVVSKKPLTDLTASQAMEEICALQRHRHTAGARMIKNPQIARDLLADYYDKGLSLGLRL